MTSPFSSASAVEVGAHRPARERPELGRRSTRRSCPATRKPTASPTRPGPPWTPGRIRPSRRARRSTRAVGAGYRREPVAAAAGPSRAGPPRHPPEKTRATRSASGSTRRASANSASRVSSAFFFLSSAIAQCLLLSVKRLFSKRVFPAPSGSRPPRPRCRVSRRSRGSTCLRYAAAPPPAAAVRARCASAASSAAMRSGVCHPRLRARRAVGDRGRGLGVEPRRAPRFPQPRSTARFATTLVQPGRRLRRSVRPPVGGRAPQPHHRFLCHVLGLRHIAQNPRGPCRSARGRSRAGLSKARGLPVAPREQQPSALCPVERRKLVRAVGMHRFHDPP